MKGILGGERGQSESVKGNYCSLGLKIAIWLLLKYSKLQLYQTPWDIEKMFPITTVCCKIHIVIKEKDLGHYIFFIIHVTKNSFIANFAINLIYCKHSTHDVGLY